MQLWNYGVEILGKRLSHGTPMLVASSLDASPGWEMPTEALVFPAFSSPGLHLIHS
jgi:hypothetical protein